MQVILPDEQIKQIQILISSLITSEIEKQIHHRNIGNSYLNKKQNFILSISSKHCIVFFSIFSKIM